MPPTKSVDGKFTTLPRFEISLEMIGQEGLEEVKSGRRKDPSLLAEMYWTPLRPKGKEASCVTVVEESPQPFFISKTSDPPMLNQKVPPPSVPTLIVKVYALKDPISLTVKALSYKNRPVEIDPVMVAAGAVYTGGVIVLSTL